MISFIATVVEDVVVQGRSISRRQKPVHNSAGAGVRTSRKGRQPAFVQTPGPQRTEVFPLLWGGAEGCRSDELLGGCRAMRRPHQRGDWNPPDFNALKNYFSKDLGEKRKSCTDSIKENAKIKIRLNAAVLLAWFNGTVLKLTSWQKQLYTTQLY